MRGGIPPGLSVAGRGHALSVLGNRRYARSPLEHPRNFIHAHQARPRPCVCAAHHVWMGNATPRNAGFGIVLGLVIGLLVASLLLLLWLPRMPDIARFLRILNIDHQPQILERHDKNSTNYPKFVNPVFF